MTNTATQEMSQPPDEGEVTNPLYRNQCYEIKSKIDGYPMQLAGHLMVDIPKGRVKTGYQEIIKLNIIKKFLMNSDLDLGENSLKERLQSINKSAIITALVWAALFFVIFLISQKHSVGPLFNGVTSGLIATVLVGWLFIVFVRRSMRVRHVLNRVIYENQIIKEENRSVRRPPDLSDINDFNQALHFCNFQKARKIAEANGWYWLVSKRAVGQHVKNIRAYMRQRSKGRQAKKATKT